MLLNKDQILKADDLPFKDIAVPEWGGDVRVSTMTAADRDAFEASIYETDSAGKVNINRKNFRANLLSRAITDDKGLRLFTEKEIDLLGKKSAKAIQRLFDAAQDLNGISKAEQDAIEKK